MGSTDLNLLLDVGFNHEVGEDAALYWKKNPGSLSHVIGKAEAMDTAVQAQFGDKAKARIRDAYSWEYIADRYQKAFIGEE